MHTLKALIDNNPDVWIYCSNENLQKQFLIQAEAEGFVTLNGQKPTELFLHQLYGINDDMTMGYLSVMIWSLTFQTGLDAHFRVDYGKFINGKGDYICHSARLKKVDYGVWNKMAYAILDSRKFERKCNSLIDNQSYEEYQAYIYRYLIESPWHYSPEQAVERIEMEAEYISQCYTDNVPVAECAAEVGYSCG